MDKIDKFRKAKYIFVVGIGGSDLASKAVWNAINLHRKVDKKVFFLESPDSREYEEVINFVATEVATPEEIVMMAVSKSGKTEETLSAFHKTFDILSEKFGRPIGDRTIIISSPNTPLSKLGEDKSATNIEWEGSIGGRFSAFTVAHTVFFQIAELNVTEFLKGKEEFPKEEAVILAKQVFESYKAGAQVWDIFLFNSELEDLGKWARQLIAESLATITPTVSIGPTDLHSMLELYLEKPQSRFTLFVKSHKEIEGGINETAYENVSQEYQKRGLHFCKYEIGEINEREIGTFMAFLMEAVLELAKLLDLNPYDQPEVENYKNSLHN